jgi:hypothetical protein
VAKTERRRQRSRGCQTGGRRPLPAARAGRGSQIQRANLPGRQERQGPEPAGSVRREETVRHQGPPRQGQGRPAPQARAAPSGGLGSAERHQLRAGPVHPGRWAPAAPEGPAPGSPVQRGPAFRRNGCTRSLDRRRRFRTGDKSFHSTVPGPSGTRGVTRPFGPLGRPARYRSAHTTVSSSYSIRAVAPHTVSPTSSKKYMGRSTLPG